MVDSSSGLGGAGVYGYGEDQRQRAAELRERIAELQKEVASPPASTMEAYLAKHGESAAFEGFWAEVDAPLRQARAELRNCDPFGSPGYVECVDELRARAALEMMVRTHFEDLRYRRRLHSSLTSAQLDGSVVPKGLWPSMRDFAGVSPLQIGKDIKRLARDAAALREVAPAVPENLAQSINSGSAFAGELLPLELRHDGVEPAERLRPLREHALAVELLSAVDADDREAIHRILKDDLFGPGALKMLVREARGDGARQRDELERDASAAREELEYLKQRAKSRTAKAVQTRKEGAKLNKLIKAWQALDESGINVMGDQQAAGNLARRFQCTATYARKARSLYLNEKGGDKAKPT